MPCSLSQAFEIANRHLSSQNAEGGGVRILSEETKEFDVGWVFYYQAARFLETGDFRDTLVGNAPVFVARADGKVFSVSYHRPLAESMAAYRACGNPNAVEVAEVVLTGWRPGALAVSAIQLIRQHSPVGLGEAKRVAEECLGDRKPVIKAHNIASARILVQSLAGVGFIGEVRYDG
jgi:hypothetical protein